MDQENIKDLKITTVICCGFGAYFLLMAAFLFFNPSKLPSMINVMIPVLLFFIGIGLILVGFFVFRPKSSQ